MSKVKHFNPQIEKLLNLYEIPVNEGLTCLLAYYYNTVCNLMPAEMEIQLTSAGIISFDILDDSLIWNIPLFEGEEAGKFDWVEKEYCALFKKYDPQMLPFAKESKNRMIKFFKENPDVRKHEVLEAVELYFREKQYSYTDSPHFFIEKGSGTGKVNKLILWVQRLREKSEVDQTQITQDRHKWS